MTSSLILGFITSGELEYLKGEYRFHFGISGRILSSVLLKILKVPLAYAKSFIPNKNIERYLM